MRRLYLFRHALPDFPNEEKYCIGSTDLPLGPLGRMQACLAAWEMKNKVFDRVFCSRLARSQETAAYLSPCPTVLDGLEEMYAGVWDGLPFSQIRQQWPEVFEARGRDLRFPIPGAETPAEGQKRFLAALDRAFAMSEGDIAVVGHATVNQTFLCHVLGLPPEEGRQFFLPYASYCVLTRDGGYHLESMANTLHPPLTPELCRALLTAAGTPETVQRHCEAVAALARKLCQALNEAGCSLDEDITCTAALLHDIARTQPCHPQVGAKWLDSLGYPKHSDILRQHHDLDSTALNEAALVFLADKLIQGEQRVPLAQRFSQAQEKCQTPEALAAHDARLAQALALRDRITQICQKEIAL